MKIAEIERLSQEELEEMQKEVEILKEVQHYYVTKYIDSFLSDNKKYFCIVMERAEGMII